MRYSIVNNDYSLPALIKALSAHAPADLSALLSAFLGGSPCLITSNGFTALELVLQHLKNTFPGRTQVILPAYTAPGLVLPIQKLGLEPVLCDISLQTFNYDIEALRASYTAKTLAIVCVHTFGIPCDITAIRTTIPDATLIEDCAQSLGSRINGQPCGTHAEFSIGSFARGKNLSMYGGGFLSCAAPETMDRVRPLYHALQPATRMHGVACLARHVAFSCLTHPVAYSILSSILANVKSTSEQQSYTAAQAGDSFTRPAGNLFSLWLACTETRNEQGMRLYERLSTLPHIRLPRLPATAQPAFNRMPVLFENTTDLVRAISQLSEIGIEASCFYGKPIHLLHRIGYSAGSCPHAEHFAQHLLTLPTYATLPPYVLDSIPEVLSHVLNTPRS